MGHDRGFSRQRCLQHQVCLRQKYKAAIKKHFLTINLFQACRRDRLRRFRLPKNKPTSGAAWPTLLPRPGVIVLNQPGQISVFIFGEHLPTSTE